MEFLYAWTGDVFYLPMVRNDEQLGIKSRLRERFSVDGLTFMTRNLSYNRKQCSGIFEIQPRFLSEHDQ